MGSGVVEGGNNTLDSFDSEEFDDDDTCTCEYMVNSYASHLKGPCNMSDETEIKWFLSVRMPEILEDLKYLLEISMEGTDASEVVYQKAASLAQGSECFTGTITFSALRVKSLDLQFVSKNYMNGQPVHVVDHDFPDNIIPEIQFAISCIHKCIKNIDNAIYEHIDNRKKIIEQAKHILNDIVLAMSPAKLNGETFNNNIRNIDGVLHKLVLPSIPSDLFITGFLNEKGQLKFTALALQFLNSDSSKSAQKKNIIKKSKFFKSLPSCYIGANVLAEDEITFECETITRFFSNLRLAKAHARNLINKLSLLYG